MLVEGGCSRSEIRDSRLFAPRAEGAGAKLPHLAREDRYVPTIKKWDLG